MKIQRHEKKIAINLLLVFSAIFITLSTVSGQGAAISYPTDTDDLEISVDNEKVISVKLFNHENESLAVNLEHNNLKNIEVIYTENLVIDANGTKTVNIYLSSNEICKFSGSIHFAFVTIGESSQMDGEVIRESEMPVVGKFFSPSPELEASFTYSPSQPEPYETVRFDADESPGGNYYRWYFGDNSIANGVTVTHKYKNEGEYNVKLIIEDMDGNKDNISKTIKVKEEPLIARKSVFLIVTIIILSILTTLSIWRLQKRGKKMSGLEGGL